MADPKRFLGRKASACRKCGSVNHYVNRLGGIVCEKCEPPAGSNDVQIRLAAVAGLWDDADNPMDPAGIEQAMEAAAVRVVRSATSGLSSAASASKTTPEGRWASPEAAIAHFAADARMSPRDWLQAMSDVFTTPDREAKWGWSEKSTGEDLREICDLYRESKKPENERKKKHDAGTAGTERTELGFVVGVGSSGRRATDGGTGGSDRRGIPGGATPGKWTGELNLGF